MLKIRLLQSSRSVLLLIIVFSVAFFLSLNQSSTLLNSKNTNKYVAEIELISGKKCNPAGKPCMATSDDLSMSLQLGKDVSAMKKFDVQVVTNKTSNIKIESVRIEFRMLDMNMAQNNYNLYAGDDGTWKGHAILPVCVSGRMDWVARVVATSGRNEYVAEYNFSSK